MGRTVLSLPLGVLIGAPAMVQAETVATPAAPWKESLEGGVCRIERRFEAGGQAHLLILEQNAPGPGFGLAVAGPSLGSLTPDLPLRLGFAEGAAAIEETARIDPNPLFGKVAVVSDLTLFQPPRPKYARLDAELLAQMDRVAVEQGNTRTTFATGSLADAARMLNDCTAKTLRGWGLDPEVQYGLQRTAFPEEAEEFARKMLRLFASRDLRSGPFEAVAIVDATGAATGCRILPGPGYAGLDAAACKMLMKARYRPALDADGRPVASFWKTSVKFNVLDPYRVQLRMNPGEP